MNVPRLLLAAVVAWVVDSLYGYVVFGLLLNAQYMQYPAVFRSFAQVGTMLPLMFGASFVSVVLVAYIFAKGREGGSGFMEGLKFGVVFALFGFFGISIPSYVIYRYGWKLAAPTSAAAFAETVLMGVVIGLVYAPPAKSAARPAAV